MMITHELPCAGIHMSMDSAPDQRLAAKICSAQEAMWSTRHKCDNMEDSAISLPGLLLVSTFGSCLKCRVVDVHCNSVWKTRSTECRRKQHRVLVVPHLCPCIQGPSQDI